MFYSDLYSEIGKMLYAVADIDGMITQAEKAALQDIVKRELVPVEKHVDEFGTDAAYYTEFEFDYLDQEKMMDAETAFNSFIDFVEEHRTALDRNTIKICLHIAEEIANAYHATNQVENVLLEKLKMKLNEI